MLGQLYHRGVLTLVELEAGANSIHEAGMTQIRTGQVDGLLPGNRSGFDAGLRLGMTRDCRLLHSVELIVRRLLGSSSIDLGLVEPRIDSSLPEKVFVGPDLGDSSVLKDH